MVLGSTVDQSQEDKIVSIIKDFWDSFSQKGVQLTVVGY